MTDLNKLLSTPLALPSIPRVVALALSELDKDEPDLKKISTHLAQDPVLTARLLRVANSAQFQLVTPVGTVIEALSILGLSHVRDMVLTAAVASAFRRIGGVDMQQFWRFSLNTAKLSRRLGHLAIWKVSPYTVGLVHALGELVMHQGMSEEMAKVNLVSNVFSTERAVIERDLLGFSYGQVGAEFAKSWSLPKFMVEVLERHDRPMEGGGLDPTSLIIHLAGWRCRAKELDYSAADLEKTFPHRVGNALELDLASVMRNDPTEWTTNQEAAALAE